MADFQIEIRRAVQDFIAQISELAHRAAVDTLASAFASRTNGRRGKRGDAAGTLVSLGRPRGARGAKRTTTDLEALSTKLMTFVKANPGLRVEEINKQLGTTTKDLALPIRKLLGNGMISSKGRRRATQYFPGRKAK
jgi:hypothetical protein